MGGWFSNFFTRLMSKRTPLVAQEFSNVERYCPDQKFHPGDLVRTVVGSKGDRVVKTRIIARVRSVGWHGDRGEWLYYLEGNARRRHRWYLAEDLDAVTETAPDGGDVA